MIGELLLLIGVALVWCAIEVWLARATDDKFTRKDDNDAAHNDLHNLLRHLQGDLAETREAMAAASAQLEGLRARLALLEERDEDDDGGDDG